ncbi:putative sulfate exporter family transporter [Nakamurella sp. A5-74]|uniref:Sulfate exporter family transporter n=1 Tax=Nakamurella sp. A5-74 TaxID=3158264 RepID=A0AAU8DR81_9ACTN
MTGARRSAARGILPGLMLVAVATGIAWLAHLALPQVSPLTFGLLLGIVLGNTGLARDSFRPGLQVAARRLLRLGIVVLGLRLSLPQVADLGLPMLIVVVATVVIAFGGTLVLARAFGLSRDAGLLLATGFSICGASAVAAMNGVTRSKESDVVTAISLVTLFGSAAILMLPALQVPLGLDDHHFGLWTGASVHDVAQTVAAASVAGPVALSAAIVVKLTRVVLLAPMVAIAAVVERRRSTSGDGATDSARVARPALLPLFVAGFLLAVLVRSSGLLPPSVLGVAQTVETTLLTAAMVGLGTSVRLRTLIRTAGRSALVGLLSWILIAGVALIGVHLAG